MNALLLRGTRALIAVAVVVSGFIINNASKITAAAVFVHKWALKAAVATADREATKASNVVTNLLTQQNVLRKLTYDAGIASVEASIRAEGIARAARVELDTLQS